MARIRGNAVALVMMAAAMLVATGCNAKGFAKRDVRVELDESLRNTSVQVDMIAVNDTEFDRWNRVPVDMYWSEGADSGGALRNTKDRHVMEFTRNETTPFKVLSKDDPIWNGWQEKGARRLVILAFIPGLSGSGEGQADPRRIVLPLDRVEWDDLGEIKIQASKSGIVSQTQPKQKKR